MDVSCVSSSKLMTCTHQSCTCTSPLEVLDDLDLERPHRLGTNLGVGFTKARVRSRSCITAESLTLARDAGRDTRVTEVMAGNTADCV